MPFLEQQLTSEQDRGDSCSGVDDIKEILLGGVEAAGIRDERISSLKQVGQMSTKGGMNTKLHAVTDANGRPIRLFVTAGQVSDYTGAVALLDSLPRAQ